MTFAQRLNQLSLAKIAVAVSQSFKSPDEAAGFLQEVCISSVIQPFQQVSLQITTSSQYVCICTGFTY